MRRKATTKPNEKSEPWSYVYFWRIIYNAISHYFQDEGSAFASHMTLSGLLALFPFMIFATSLASFLGAGVYTERSVNYIFDMLPNALAKPITNEVINVLTIQRGGLLTVSVIMTAYFASNGVEALRSALNRAYRVRDKRSIFFCRFQSLFFVIIGTVGLMVISLFLVLAPLVITIAQREFATMAPYIGTIRIWRYGLAILILFLSLLFAHKWLPAGERKISDILPGVIFTLIVWFIASIVFAQYLASFANYVSTYAGLASIMVAIIFLYILSVIFIVGGELNAAIMFYRNRRQQPGQFIRATELQQLRAHDGVANENHAFR